MKHLTRRHQTPDETAYRGKTAALLIGGSGLFPRPLLFLLRGKTAAILLN